MLKVGKVCIALVTSSSSEMPAEISSLIALVNEGGVSHVSIGAVAAPRGLELVPIVVRPHRFDLENAEQMELFQGLYRRLFYWSRQVTLDRNPPMPVSPSSTTCKFSHRKRLD
jgi:hypothetical protein